MLCGEMRHTAHVIAHIVASLLVLSHPVHATVEYAEIPWVAHILSERVAYARNMPLARELTPFAQQRGAEHSFYPSFLIGPAETAAVLLVIGIDAPDHVWSTALRLADEFAVIVVGAPDNPDRVAAMAARGADLPPDLPRIVLQAGNRFEWELGTPQSVAPVWVARGIAAVAGTNLSAPRLFAARLGYGAENRVLDGILRREVGAAQLTLDQATAADQVPTIRGALRRLAFTDQRAWERHYLVLPALPFGAGPYNPTVIGESVMVWSVVGAIAALLAIAMLRPQRTRRYVHVLSRRLPLLLILIAVTSGALIGANAVIGSLAREALGAVPPLVLAFGKIALAVLTGAVALIALHVHFMRGTTVYAAAAILFFLVLLIAAAFWNLALVPLLLWSLTAATLFSLARNAVIKALWFLVAITPLLFQSLALLTLGDPRLVEDLLTPTFTFEVLVAIALLPVLLMFLRLDFLTRRVPLFRWAAHLAAVTVLVTALLSAMYYMNPPPVVPSVTQITDVGGAARFVVSASATPTADFFPVRIVRDGEEVVIGSCEALPCNAESSVEPPGAVEARIAQRLERYQVNLTVQHAREAQNVRLVIDFDRPVQLYESSLPATPDVGATANRFVLHPGASPPARWTAVLVVWPQTTPVVSQVTIDAARPTAEVHLQRRGAESPTMWEPIAAQRSAVDRTVGVFRLE